mmetsp:Transcript_35075/g.104673  ORF Transcript_35075/g.104673 Transcript_35075/m.104673 type:complete len:585 (-) Transcript_35075:488-2242(-)
MLSFPEIVGQLEHLCAPEERRRSVTFVGSAARQCASGRDGDEDDIEEAPEIMCARWAVFPDPRRGIFRPRGCGGGIVVARASPSFRCVEEEAARMSSAPGIDELRRTGGLGRSSFAAAEAAGRPTALSNAAGSEDSSRCFPDKLIPRDSFPSVPGDSGGPDSFLAELPRRANLPSDARRLGLGLTFAGGASTLPETFDSVASKPEPADSRSCGVELPRPNLPSDPRRLDLGLVSVGRAVSSSAWTSKSDDSIFSALFCIICGGAELPSPNLPREARRLGLDLALFVAGGAPLSLSLSLSSSSSSSTLVVDCCIICGGAELPRPNLRSDARRLCLGRLGVCAASTFPPSAALLSMSPDDAPRALPNSDLAEPTLLMRPREPRRLVFAGVGVIVGVAADVAAPSPPLSDANIPATRDISSSSDFVRPMTSRNGGGGRGGSGGDFPPPIPLRVVIAPLRVASPKPSFGDDDDEGAADCAATKYLAWNDSFSGGVKSDISSLWACSFSVIADLPLYMLPMEALLALRFRVGGWRCCRCRGRDEAEEAGAAAFGGNAVVINGRPIDLPPRLVEGFSAPRTGGGLDEMWG